jgi:release factor glutamine methyltransferase
MHRVESCDIPTKLDKWWLPCSMTYREAESILKEELSQLYDERESQQLAAWVLEHISGKKKTERLVSVRQNMNTEETSKWEQVKSRMLQGEPIQYVLNEAPFMKWVLAVNPSTLIPRPETEQLVEWLLTDHPGQKNIKVLDAGTGSGCIAIAVKSERPDWEVIAGDINQQTLNLAQSNAQNSGVTISFLELNILNLSDEHWPEGLNLIISNPPYIPFNERPTLSKNVIDFEPERALFVPSDQPLLFYEALGKAALRYLLPGGMLYLEIHQEFGQAIIDLLEQLGMNASLRKDFRGNDRMIRAVKI